MCFVVSEKMTWVLGVRWDKSGVRGHLGIEPDSGKKSGRGSTGSDKGGEEKEVALDNHLLLGISNQACPTHQPLCNLKCIGSCDTTGLIHNNSKRHILDDLLIKRKIICSHVWEVSKLSSFGSESSSHKDSEFLKTHEHF